MGLSTSIVWQQGGSYPVIQTAGCLPPMTVLVASRRKRLTSDGGYDGLRAAFKIGANFLRFSSRSDTCWTEEL